MNTKELMQVFIWFFVTILISGMGALVIHFTILDDYTTGCLAGNLVAISYYEIVHSKDKR